MVLKVLGILVLILGLAGAVFSLVSFPDTNAMATVIAAATARESHPVEAADWASHWRASSFVMLVVSLAWFGAGLGMLRRRRWSLLVLTFAALALLVVQVLAVALEYAKYAYEVPEATEMAFLFLVAISSAIGYRRWPVSPQAVNELS
ncbi:MAG: hypothetical protein U0X73_17500 [Thermoanaerobaculia bacterium]